MQGLVKGIKSLLTFLLQVPGQNQEPKSELWVLIASALVMALDSGYIPEDSRLGIIVLAGLYIAGRSGIKIVREKKRPVELKNNNITL